MTPEEQRQEAREAIAKIFEQDKHDEEALGEFNQTPLERADQILNLKQIAILDEKQGLPNPPEFYNDWGGESAKDGYLNARDDMVKAGWRKCLPKEVTE